MAVERAWVTADGRVIHQLTDEQMLAFKRKLISGLNNLAYQHVLEELKLEKQRVREDRAVSTAGCQ
ncbi:hypothetical protein Desku_0979 [Desulfofundulus kuznetsovii DSM 6115]|uniref:Uncharacterized protein n=1 Tax=Desulfofundulus kuznetsovii (strain DSM 6115 / VKM B-1805 / 17) TaxID=760568 RepID=A0AAU8PUN5_DESK7|nr:hypothetical protein Desku_0979 [Desulfofundulus kuznetsovii DSM 6115]